MSENLAVVLPARLGSKQVRAAPRLEAQRLDEPVVALRAQRDPDALVIDVRPESAVERAGMIRVCEKLAHTVTIRVGAHAACSGARWRSRATASR